MAFSNVSAVINHFPTVNEGFTTTLGVGGVLSGGTSIPITTTSGLTNGSVFVGIIEPGEVKEQTFTGTIDVGGSQITGVKWTRGTNVDHLAGVTIVDYVTGTAINMIIKGLLTVINQTGGLKASLAMTTPTFTTPTFQGTVDGWIGANESWTYASATTITVPSDATTKYDVGDYVKLTQSATIKYFVVTTVATTLLTVTGLNGVTVANSAITANAYSKVRNPHGTATIAGNLPYNPYKFRVYRTAALSTANNASAILTFDTKDYDTSSNIDVVTNKGRFTAPIAGYYHFDAAIDLTNGANVEGIISLYKNGGEITRGGRMTPQTNHDVGVTVSDTLRLAASDYIEVNVFSSAATAYTVGSSPSPYFSGYLVSTV